MVHVSGRISKEQFDILDKIAKIEHTDRSTVLRKIIDLGSKEYFRRKAVEMYREGKISIGKASEVAGLSIWNMYEVLEKEGITIKIDRKALENRFREDFEV
ncbi:MAG: UPF0175 family protein [Candidatus Hydrothermarchaeota archaeon]